MNHLYKSPNYDERNAAINMIVLHYTDTKTCEDAINILVDPERKVSSHYVVDETGEIIQLVDESKRAWHAGKSFWRGMRDVNANSIGIEIFNPGHLWGYRKFSDKQYIALIKLCGEIKQRYSIKNINIVGHSDIAPDRKKDPGELFDWQLLADNNIGLWPIKKSKDLNLDLTQLGYEFHNDQSIIAFQRHWRQNKVDGIWDDECCGILGSLLKRLSR